MNKKAISTIIATVILILLTLVAVGIIWATINNQIQDNIDEGESCGIDIVEKVNINNKYTCYNSTSNQFQFSISIGDVSLDSVLVSIDIGGSSSSFVMNSTASAISGVSNYPDGGGLIQVPGKNSGKTYFYDTTTMPDSIQIAPTIGGNTCPPTDSLLQIDPCEIFI